MKTERTTAIRRRGLIRDDRVAGRSPETFADTIGCTGDQDHGPGSRGGEDDLAASGDPIVSRDEWTTMPRFFGQAASGWSG